MIFSLNTGTYNLFMQYLAGANYTEAVTLRIVIGPSFNPVLLSMQQSGGQFLFLGQFTVRSTDIISVILVTSDALGVVTFDALKIVPTSQISGSRTPTPSLFFSEPASPSLSATSSPTNSASKFATLSNTPSASPPRPSIPPATLNVNSQTRDVILDSLTYSFVEIGGAWDLVTSTQANLNSFFRSSQFSTHMRFIIPIVAGTFDLYVWFVADTSHATNADVVVFDGLRMNHRTLNMKAGGSQWTLLGTFTFDGISVYSVTFLTGGDINGRVCVDALRISLPSTTSSPSQSRPASAQLPTVSILPSSSPKAVRANFDTGNDKIIKVAGETTLVTLDGSWQRIDGYLRGSPGLGSVAIQIRLPVTGTYTIAIWVDGKVENSAAALVTLFDGSQNHEYSVDMRTSGQRWVTLERLALQPSAFMVIWATEDTNVIVADSIRLLTQVSEETPSQTPTATPTFLSTAAENVVDFNPDSTYTELIGSWESVVNTLANQQHYLRGLADTGAGVARVLFQVPALAIYEVSLWVFPEPSFDDQIPISISDGEKVILVNFSLTNVTSAGFRRVGFFSFDPTRESFVAIAAAGTSNFVPADAIRFQLAFSVVEMAVGDQLVIDVNSPVDEPLVGITGNWQLVQGVSTAQSGDFLTGTAAAKSKSVEIIMPASTGEYEVEIWHPVLSNGDRRVPISISTGAGTPTTLLLDMATRPGQWISLGSFLFSGRFGSVTISTDGTSGSVAADAIRITRQSQTLVSITQDAPYVVDSSSASQIRVVGPWSRRQNPRANGGEDLLGTASRGASKVVFDLPLPPGRFAVDVFADGLSLADERVPISVNGVVKRINMKTAKGWTKVGDFEFDGLDTQTVEIRTDGTTGFVIADAVRVRIADPPSSKKVPVGAAIGIVIAGVTVALIILVLAVVYKRRKRTKASDSEKPPSRVQDRPAPVKPKKETRAMSPMADGTFAFPVDDEPQQIRKQDKAAKPEADPKPTKSSVTKKSEESRSPEADIM
eukprot:c17609_g1_i1.p1 GENE.c17609_g1_i1~~c17609_g1_i1.p1  ORF type:complete len:1085 (+),score=192.68 c17609_g1_i1:255-3257(+)